MSTLGELAVYLTANTAKFNSGLIHAERSLINFKNKAFGILGALGVGYSLSAVYKKAVKEYAEQEQASKNLTAALKYQGANYQNIMPKAEAFADEMQRITKYSDETILNEMAFAARLGVSSNKLKDFTKAAIGLSSLLGKDLNTSMLMLIRASNGNFTQLERLGFSTKNAGDASQKYNEILQKSLKGFQISKEEINTLSGATNQLGKSFNELLETIGGGVSLDVKFLNDISLYIYKMNDALKENQTILIDTSTIFKASMAEMGASLKYFYDLATSKTAGTFFSNIWTQVKEVPDMISSIWNTPKIAKGVNFQGETPRTYIDMVKDFYFKQPFIGKPNQGLPEIQSITKGYESDLQSIENTKNYRLLEEQKRIYDKINENTKSTADATKQLLNKISVDGISVKYDTKSKQFIEVDIK